MITLTTGPHRIDLLRCGPCGGSTWLCDGLPVSTAEALSVLARLFNAAQGATRMPTPRGPARGRETEPPPVDEPALAELLVGWRVLGAQA